MRNGLAMWATRMNFVYSRNLRQKGLYMMTFAIMYNPFSCVFYDERTVGRRYGVSGK